MSMPAFQNYSPTQTIQSLEIIYFINDLLCDRFCTRTCDLKEQDKYPVLKTFTGKYIHISIVGQYIDMVMGIHVDIVQIPMAY